MQTSKQAISKHASYEASRWWFAARGRDVLPCCATVYLRLVVAYLFPLCNHHHATFHIGLSAASRLLTGPAKHV